MFKLIGEFSLMVLILCLMTGCISAMQDGNAFPHEFGAAVAQESPELSISSLRGIQSFPSDDSRIEVQSAIAYLALRDENTPFLPEVRKLKELTAGKPLHELSAAVQVLLYLGHKVDGGADVMATADVRNTVDDLCDVETDFGLSRYIEDINELNEQMFRRYMVSACADLVKGETGEVINHHLVVAVISRSPAQACSLDLTGNLSPSARVSAWFECELKQASGIDMRDVLNGEEV